MPHGQRDDAALVQTIFLDSQAAYSLLKVPDLIGLAPTDVLQAIRQGVLELQEVGRDLRVSWADLVTVGLERRWTLRTLTEALQDHDVPSLPFAVRVIPGHVQLPRYQWQLLRWLAAEQSRQEFREITLDDLLEEAVSAAVAARSIDWNEVEKSLPGTRAAFEWPMTNDEPL